MDTVCHSCASQTIVIIQLAQLYVYSEVGNVILDNPSFLHNVVQCSQPPMAAIVLLLSRDRDHLFFSTWQAYQCS